MKFNILQLKPNISEKNYDLLKSFLKDCPKNIIQQMEIDTFKKGQILMSAGEKPKDVYILIFGTIEALDENVPNLPYIFTDLYAFEILGDFELFAESKLRYVTLRATSDCICIKIKARIYNEWMKEDNNALFLRVKLLLKQLGFQTQFERQFLFLDCKTRLVLYFLEQLKKETTQFPYIVKDNREYIAGKLGCSVRALNRTIALLEMQTIISRQNRKIIIEEKHVDKLYKIIEDSKQDMKFTVPIL